MHYSALEAKLALITLVHDKEKTTCIIATFAGCAEAHNELSAPCINIPQNPLMLQALAKLRSCAQSFRPWTPRRCPSTQSISTHFQMLPRSKRFLSSPWKRNLVRQLVVDAVWYGIAHSVKPRMSDLWRGCCTSSFMYASASYQQMATAVHWLTNGIVFMKSSGVSIVWC